MSFPIARLGPLGQSRLDQLLNEQISRKNVPCIFWAVTNARETIYENQAGNMIMDDTNSGAVGVETTLELYSMTKFVVCLSILQLVDEDLLDLDDPNIVYEYLPELGEQQVLEGYDEAGRPILVPQNQRITVKMLMNHTAGCTTPQRNPQLAKWYHAQPSPAPGNLTTGASVRTLMAPLLFQPGTSWMYSSGTDWLGVFITRLTGLTLEEYFQQNIFSRVDGGMPDTTFYPRKDIGERKVAIYQRKPDGSLWKYPHFSEGRPDTVDTVSKEFLSGAGGLFGTTRDYLALCRAVLQCDPRYPSPPRKPLVSTKSFQLLFTPSLTETHVKEKAAAFFVTQNCWSPKPTGDTANHSIAFAITMANSDHGRREGSGGWYGMAHTQYWLDPSSGLAGVCNTQIVGPDPDPWNNVYNNFERTLYDNLNVSGS